MEDIARPILNTATRGATAASHLYVRAYMGFFLIDSFLD